MSTAPVGPATPVAVTVAVGAGLAIIAPRGSMGGRALMILGGAIGLGLGYQLFRLTRGEADQTRFFLNVFLAVALGLGITALLRVPFGATQFSGTFVAALAAGYRLCLIAAAPRQAS